MRTTLVIFLALIVVLPLLVALISLLFITKPEKEKPKIRWGRGE